MFNCIDSDDQYFRSIYERCLFTGDVTDTEMLAVFDTWSFNVWVY